MHIKTTLLAVFALIPFSRNAALSIYEQKKYKNFLEGQGLYNASDDIEILTVHNFNRELYGARHAWIVEFYNSWCGHCQRFAPSWKALGTDVKGWRDIVRVGAIDCSDDDNYKICRNFEIMSYPTLHYFPANYQAGPKNFGVPMKTGDDLYSLKRNLIERMIISESEGGEGGTYSLLLSPYTYGDLSHLHNSNNGLNQVFKYSFVIIESDSTWFGPQLALDYHKISDIIVRYSFSNNTALIENLGITNLPALVVVSGKDNKSKELSLSNDLGHNNAIKAAIKSFLQSNQVNMPDDTLKSSEIYTGKWVDAGVPDMNMFMQERARQALKERIKKMGDVIFQMDLETAVRYSLKHEVASVKTIIGDKLEALIAYINILVKYFPFGHKGQIFLNVVQETVAKLAQTTGMVEGAVLLDLIKSAELEESQVFSSPQQWLACKGSAATYRGYPCGLWKMFHYLTVNHAENQKNAPRQVLDAMLGYVKHFFGCDDCSRHFQEMAITRDMANVSSLDSSILWLWMAHNNVNKRLSGDATEDPEYPKYQFPAPDRCPQCRSGSDTGPWDLVEVLKYLKHMYSSINVRYIGSDTRILHIGLEGPLNNAADHNGFFKTIDTGLCLILYVASFMLLVVLIRMFMKRGYRKKLYVHDLLGKV